MATKARDLINAECIKEGSLPSNTDGSMYQIFREDAKLLNVSDSGRKWQHLCELMIEKLENVAVVNAKLRLDQQVCSNVKRISGKKHLSTKYIVFTK